MSKLQWWMRLVGGIYVLLGLLNAPPVVRARLFEQHPNLGVPADSVAVDALVDIWFMFGVEICVLGSVLIYFSRTPARAVALAWAVIALEIVRGVLFDLYLIARGQDAVFYAVFALVHVVIIVTGVRSLRALQQSGLAPSS